MTQDELDRWVIRGFSGLLKILEQNRRGKGYSQQAKNLFEQYRNRLLHQCVAIPESKIEEEFFPRDLKDIDNWLITGFETIAAFAIRRLEHNDVQPGFKTQLQFILRRLEHCLRREDICKL